ncbi:MAG: hypothetical protein V2A79_10780 [Planctomycetota bacterium]
MKRTTFCVALGLAAVLCLSSAAAQSVGQGAGPPTLPRPAPTLFVATIKGPDAVSPGDLLILEAQAPAGCRCAWLVYPARSALPVDGGQRLVFASGQPGSYLFVLAVASPTGEVAIAQKTVAVGAVPGPPGPSPPAPTPPVPPAPGPAPIPLTELGEAVRSWATSLVVGAGREIEARAMADVYAGVAAQIAAGTLGTPEKIAAETKAGIDGVTIAAPRVAQWRMFYQRLRERLNYEEAAGKMTPAGIQARWLEIAAGLRAVTP